jgi:hypothetical protein
LASGLLKLNNFIQYNTINERRDQRYWRVGQGQCGSFNEGVIKSCLVMPGNYGAV